jgi:hypothetical protein
MRGKKMKAVVQMCLDTTENWRHENPLLYNGVWAMEVQPDGTRRLKVGDGKKRWQQLDYLDVKWFPEIQERFSTLNIKIDGMSGLLPLGAVDFEKSLNLNNAEDVQALNTEAIIRTPGAASITDVIPGSMLLNSFDGTEFVWNSQIQQWIKWGNRGILNEFQKRIVGEYRYLSYEPDPFWLAQHRLMPLRYQILPIALYQELFNIKWVGSGKNATADWWYKCYEDGERSLVGDHFRVEDARGLFHRAAGQNAIKRAANDTPS